MSIEIRAVLVEAGWVGIPLVLVSVALWFVATMRLFNVRRGFSGSVVARVEEALRRGAVVEPHGPVERYLSASLLALRHRGTCQHHLERFLRLERERVTDYGLVHMGLVTVAPLLGLLGTVGGMIETFWSMQGTVVAHAAEQTMAGGISMALVSTQLGLVIGVPGLAAARYLARQEQRRVRELSQAHSLLVQRHEVPR